MNKLQVTIKFEIDIEDGNITLDEIKEEIMDIETSEPLTLSPVTPKISSVTSLSVAAVTPLTVKAVTPKLTVTHVTPVTPNVSVTQIISGTSNEPVKLRAFVTPKTTVTQEDVETQCDLEREEKTVTQNSKEVYSKGLNE